MGLKVTFITKHKCWMPGFWRQYFEFLYNFTSVHPPAFIHMQTIYHVNSLITNRKKIQGWLSFLSFFFSYQKTIPRMSCCVIIRSWHTPSFTFQCFAPIRMTLEWKCSNIIVWRIDLIFSMSIQYHLSTLIALNDYAYHLVIVFYPFSQCKLIFKVDMRLDYKRTHGKETLMSVNMSMKMWHQLPGREELFLA